MKEIEIKKVTKEEANKLLDSCKDYGCTLKWEPLGLFYTIDKDKEGKNVYIGFDNSTGDCWTEEFKSLSGCKNWLLRRGNGGW